MKKTIISALVLTAVASGITPKAQALTLDLFDTGNTTQDLVNAVLSPNSGINVVGGVNFQGDIGNGTDPNTAQSAIYSNFSLAPSSGSTPTFTLPNGIFLTSGTANIPTTNTLNNFSNALPQPGSGSNAALSALSGSSTFDANALSFNFTVDAAFNSVTARFLFGTDEFPTQNITDIFGFFVDGVNYARFADGSLVSNTPGNPTNFTNNPVGGGLYPIEYNGLSQGFAVIGMLDPNLTTHTIQIAVADTNDSIFDSGVFIGALQAANNDDGGIIVPPQDVPEPTPLLTLIGLGFLGTLSAKFRKNN